MTNLLEHQSSWNHSLDNSEDTITSRFERQVAAVPDKVAIVTDEISLTYRALDLKASRIAAGLASLPSQHNQPILLFMKDEAAWIVAMLGALRAHRIFLPLAPNSPAKWLAQVIEDSGAAQIIVDDSTRSMAELAASRDGVALLEVDRLAQSSESFVADRTASPDDTACVVYTSGSTGRPKGVANSHRSLVRRCDVRNLVFGLGRSDRHANLRSIGVSSAINNILLPLLSGGCLFPFNLHRDGLQKLTPWLIAQQITYVNLSASLLRTWLASLPDNVRFSALRRVNVASERLYAQDVIRLARHLKALDWWIGHSYSSTESGFIAAEIFTASSLPTAGIVALGRPVDGMEVCIKDETGAPVPPGGIGVIVVRSRFLAQGYWNNPGLTAKVFQTDPRDNAVRIYHTGDLGRWRSDGTLEHMGRKGRGIRLRGHNIEPFQVECELLRQPGVTDAVALLHDGAAGEEPCLLGYVVALPHISPSDIRQGLAECLPSHMVPSHIVVLDSFPKLGSGKIDRTALPQPRRKKAALRPTSDSREQELLEIWQEVLKISKIGIDDDFFELGGTSLQVLIMFAQIEARLGRNLSPTTIVQAPTIARLAEFIRATIDIASSQSLVPLRASGTGSPLFLVAPGYYGVLHYPHLLKDHKDLKSDCPIFGLQPLPLDGMHGTPRTIEAIAAKYVTEIRRVQPHGPYFVAGYSFGGRVSFEIAQQLVRGGERVSFLGMIDTRFHDMPVEGWPLASEAVRLGRKVRTVHGLQDLLFRGFSFVKWRVFRQEIFFRWYDRSRQGRSDSYERQSIYYDGLCKRASRSYVPKPYPGHITMFSSIGNSERQRADWEPLALGGLTVLEVPAGHMDMVSPPHSKLLTEYFTACLDASIRQEQELVSIQTIAESAPALRDS